MSHNDYRTKGEHCQPKTLNIALKGRKGDETQGPLRILWPFQSQRNTETLKYGENIREHSGIRRFEACFDL